ncbi:MAG TPA: acyl-CoA dehydrogenase [Acidimicrobiales bacterium]|nr:acyl-CoA dehydrogenase [Acidimicrobiales bacterium]
MAEYTAPLRDIRFNLEHLVDLQSITELPPFEHVDADGVYAVLEENARFMEDLVAPLNRVGDLQGSVRNDDGSVTTPEGFKEAYRAYVDAGWGAVPFPPEYGGGSFPWLVGVALQEILTSANMSFSMLPLLNQGALDMLLHHASEEQREVYLPKMVTGEWTGTMNLTEPQAGSDVGALTTKAVPQDDGTYRITGTKIFITYGEHDMSDNIVHLVLARTPSAPPGTKGISCFIVPKHLVNDDGSLGERNDVTCVSIEHKMGIKASPTCVLSYGEKGEGAVGYLIGEENAGMRYMFTMMNNARLSVGLQGLSIAERAYQMALDYAKERRQGRAPGAPAGEQSPIVDHPDVRRMLLTMRSSIAALRGIVYANAAAIDRAAHHPDEAVRAGCQELADLLTPVSKGWGTDLGVELTSLAIQVFGGMGYIEETGVAQHFRDARIAPIYEGTNGIQAMDLVGRKLPMRAGAAVTDYLGYIERTVADLEQGGDELASIRAALADGLGALRTATDWLLANGLGEPLDALAGATPYLRLFSVVTGGWVMAQQALAATRLLAEAGPGDKAFYEGKVLDARFFCEQLLPQAAGLVPAVTATNRDLAAAVF